MDNSDLPFSEAIQEGLKASFLEACEIAKRTQTGIVIEEAGRIKHILYDKIDAFLEESVLSTTVDRTLIPERKLCWVCDQSFMQVELSDILSIRIYNVCRNEDCRLCGTHFLRKVTNVEFKKK